MEVGLDETVNGFFVDIALTETFEVSPRRDPTLRDKQRAGAEVVGVHRTRD